MPKRTTPQWHYPTPEGWHYNPTFGVFQKCHDKRFVYITRMIGFYMLQIYDRGRTIGHCGLEARSRKRDFDALVKLGEEWLEKYGDGKPYDVKEGELFSLWSGNWYID